MLAIFFSYTICLIHLFILVSITSFLQIFVESKAAQSIYIML